jgi:hypothetical protein
MRQRRPTVAEKTRAIRAWAKGDTHSTGRERRDGGRTLTQVPSFSIITVRSSANCRHSENLRERRHQEGQFRSSDHPQRAYTENLPPRSSATCRPRQVQHTWRAARTIQLAPHIANAKCENSTSEVRVRKTKKQNFRVSKTVVVFLPLIYYRSQLRPGGRNSISSTSLIL